MSSCGITALAGITGEFWGFSISSHGCLYVEFSIAGNISYACYAGILGYPIVHC
jgi:hypothetical protein